MYLYSVGTFQIRRSVSLFEKDTFLPFNCNYSQKVEFRRKRIILMSINNERAVSENCMQLRNHIKIKKAEKRKFELAEKENLNYSTTVLNQSMPEWLMKQ